MQSEINPLLGKLSRNLVISDVVFLSNMLSKYSHKYKIAQFLYCSINLKQAADCFDILRLRYLLSELDKFLNNKIKNKEVDYE